MNYPQPSATTSGSIRNLGIAVDRVQYANLRTLCGESIVPEKLRPVEMLSGRKVSE